MPVGVPGTNYADVSPPVRSAAVTPDDNIDLAGGLTLALWIGGAGNVSVILADDSNPVTLTAVPVGTMLSLRVRRVRATNTTATLIVALFKKGLSGDCN